MFNFFKSTKSNFKSFSLNIINMILTLTTLLYMVSVFGFDHLNKDLLFNFMIGTGFIIFLLTIIIMTIIFIFYVAFKIMAAKLNVSLNTFVTQAQDTLNKKGKAQHD